MRLEWNRWLVLGMTLSFQIGTQIGANASIMPPNDLWRYDNLLAPANMDEATFRQISERVTGIFDTFARIHNARIVLNARWDDSTVNASAQQTGSNWAINMYGGLARRPEVTPDGFALVVCHELGHHFAGFPFYKRSIFSSDDWAAVEGQSDYFATTTCAKMIWGEEASENARFRTSAPEIVRDRCDAAWSAEGEQNLCYRSSMAGLSLATLLGALGSNSSAPDFGHPDSSVVSKTNPAHPKAQCRLDTYFAGAQCMNANNPEIIPGRRHASGQDSAEAEQTAQPYACYNAVASRPACWFKSKLSARTRSDRI